MHLQKLWSCVRTLEYPVTLNIHNQPTSVSFAIAIINPYAIIRNLSSHLCLRSSLSP